MGDDSKTNIQMGFMAAAIILAGVILYVNHSGGGGTGRVNRTMYMICVNQDCLKQKYELSAGEFRKMMQAQDPEGGAGLAMGIGQMVFECKYCGQKAAYTARKCENCETIFPMSYDATDDYPDRCPECGYSGTEAAKSNR